MNKENILRKLKTENVDIILLDSVDSTNNYLKQLAKNGANAKTVVIANSQTAGKGSKNRSFISRKGGVYLSILLKTDLIGFDATAITPLAAVAVSDTIDRISGKTTGIKWVNDVYLDNKKVSGILCESVIDANGQIPYVVVGIGVNLFKPENDFDEEIKDIATCVFQKADILLKEEFVTSLIDCFFDYYSKIKEKSFLEKYRKSNIVLGKNITFQSDNNTVSAIAVAIDDDCRLIIELPDKTKKTLSSGEVTIKL